MNPPQEEVLLGRKFYTYLWGVCGSQHPSMESPSKYCRSKVYPCASMYSRFSRVQLFATLWTVACQAPLSMGFSRHEGKMACKEYWSGLSCPPPGDLPNPTVKPRSPILQVDYLLSESPGKPKNTGVGGQSLLQEIFSTQELNRGLLNCRWILYQLSYQESPHLTMLLLLLSHFSHVRLCVTP